VLNAENILPGPRPIKKRCGENVTAKSGVKVIACLGISGGLSESGEDWTCKHAGANKLLNLLEPKQYWGEDLK